MHCVYRMPTLLPEICIPFCRGILRSWSRLSSRSTATPLTLYPHTSVSEIAVHRFLLVFVVAVSLLTAAGMKSRAASDSGGFVAKSSVVSDSEPDFIEVDPTGRYVRVYHSFPSTQYIVCSICHFRIEIEFNYVITYGVNCCQNQRTENRCQNEYNQCLHCSSICS